MIRSFVVFFARPCISLESQPMKSIQDRLLSICGISGLIGIFDTQQISPLLLLGKQSRIQSGPHSTYMEVAGWRWRKTRDDSHEQKIKNKKRQYYSEVRRVCNGGIGIVISMQICYFQKIYLFVHVSSSAQFEYITTSCSTSKNNSILSYPASHSPVSQIINIQMSKLSARNIFNRLSYKSLVPNR